MSEPASPTHAYEPLEDQDEWLEEAELPRRPRRRIISPIPLALLGVLLVACGFIAGVLVEKGQTSSSPAGSAASLASRFAALRGASGAAAAAGASLFGGGAGAGGSDGGSPGAPGPAGGATAGSVAYISGDTLYVTTAEGNTVRINTSAGTPVSKTVKADVAGIHPGEAVVITGTPARNGSISAESIRVVSGLGGGLGALFGGPGTGAGRGGGGANGGGGPQLFGPG